MRDPVHFIPIVTTIVAAFFAPVVYKRWLVRKTGPHINNIDPSFMVTHSLIGARGGPVAIIIIQS